ncbi:hypothetical protein AWV80_00335 [Cupriavidus sp. UYMU48A]|nr:hypothetical protein AWV80_00335 [Cupriavidus sp. UYMU48A]
MGDEENACIDAIVNMNLEAKTIIFGRLTDADLSAALHCNADIVNLSIPVSDLYFQHLRQSRSWVLAQIARLIQKAAKCHPKISLGMDDASRADPAFLVEVAQCSRRYGAQRIRFSATIGAIGPFRTYDIIAKLRDAVDLDMEIYAQNDLGLATANTLAAFRAGASHVNTIVNRMVRPEGNAALDEVVMGVRHLRGPDTGIDTKALIPISSLVKDASERAGPSNKTSIGIDSLRVRHWRPQYCESSYGLRPNRYDTPDSKRALVVNNSTTDVDYENSGDYGRVFQDRMGERMKLELREPAPQIDGKSFLLILTTARIPLTWLCYFPNNSVCLPFIQRGARHACRPSVPNLLPSSLLFTRSKDMQGLINHHQHLSSTEDFFRYFDIAFDESERQAVYTS